MASEWANNADSVGIVAFSPLRLGDPDEAYHLDPSSVTSGRGVFRLANINGLVITSWGGHDHRAHFRAIGGTPVYRTIPSSSAPRTLYEPTATQPLLYLEGCSDIVVSQLQFDGNRAERIDGLPAGAQISHLGGHNINIRACKRVLLQDVASVQAPGAGCMVDGIDGADGVFELEGIPEDVVVRNCAFDRNAYLGLAFTHVHRARIEGCYFGYTNHASTMAGLSLETLRRDTYLFPAIWNVRVEDCDFVGNWKGIHMPGAGDSGFICVHDCRFADDATEPFDLDLDDEGSPFACSLTSDAASTAVDCGMAHYGVNGVINGNGRPRAHTAINSSMRWVSITSCVVHSFSAEDRIAESVFALQQGGDEHGATGNCVLVSRCVFRGIDTQPGGPAGGGIGRWQFLQAGGGVDDGGVVAPIRVTRNASQRGDDVYLHTNVWIIEPSDRLERDRQGSFIEIERDGVEVRDAGIVYRDLLEGPYGGPGTYWVGQCEYPQSPQRWLLRNALGLAPGTAPPWVVHSPGWVYWSYASCPSGVFSVPPAPEPPL